MQKWVHIDEEYLKQLRAVEKRIPFSDYGNDKFKPFFGVLFTVGELSYVTQVSSPKHRHKYMNNQKDFRKIYDRKGKLLCVVNLNYMFPIPSVLIEDVKYSNIDKYRTFKNDNEKSSYISLLKKELSAINKLNLEDAAKILYDLKKYKPNDTISKRCFDFIALEKIAKQIVLK